ncbi:MAG TPA: hypothetical protein VHB79_38820 [Polyangiaceae bacterium]|nr:hypothetical protein [Polyangiaceae bacterium]
MASELRQNETEALQELSSFWGGCGIRAALALAIALARALQAGVDPGPHSPELAKLLAGRPLLTLGEREILQAVAALNGTSERAALAHVIEAARVRLKALDGSAS